MKLPACLFTHSRFSFINCWKPIVANNKCLIALQAGLFQPPLSASFCHSTRPIVRFVLNLVLSRAVVADRK
ncbi:MAG: hypothetical protein M3X11_11450, partial [Acidobacteriota bacterium]|nr:hypothetical protein [Acidobacteriota bacterium]